MWDCMSTVAQPSSLCDPKRSIGPTYSSLESQKSCNQIAPIKRSLHKVLGDHTLGNGSNDPRDAICVHGDVAGTVSSTIIFLAQPDHRFYAFNCPRPPSR